MLRITQFVLLVVLTVGSAIAVLVNAYEARSMNKKIYELEREQQELVVTRGQLLIERSSLVTPARVESRAKRELEMFVPEVNEIRVVKP